MSRTHDALIAALATLVLFCGVGSAQSQALKLHEDFSMAVAKFQFTQNWSITSDVTDVLETWGAADAVVQDRVIRVVDGTTIIDDWFYDNESPSKVLQPNPCDFVEADLQQTVFCCEFSTCDGSQTTAPHHCDAWAKTELCGLDGNWWQLTGDAVANAKFVLGPTAMWEIYGDERLPCDFQGCCLDPSCDDSEYTGSNYVAMPAQSLASAAIFFQSGKAIGITGTFSVTSQVGLVREVWCGLSHGPNPNPTASVVGAGMVTFAAEAMNSDSTTEHDYAQGLLVWHDDGTATRLGVFADSSFVPVDDGNGNMTISVTDFPISLAISSSDVVELNVSTSSDFAQVPDGEMDDVEGVCWSDRESMRPLAGTALGDGEYSLHADFDLDGDVDATDVTAFNATPCSADVNCDGVVNSIDMTAFLNLWSAQNPSADINMDGAVNTMDTTAYLNAWNVPC